MIKKFNEFVNEELEAVSAALNPEALLNNSSTEINRALGLKAVPSALQGKSSIGANQVGVYDEEVDTVVDWLDWPMDGDDVRRFRSWIGGQGIPGPFNNSFTLTGELKDRCVEIGGMWYPAVDHLRASYNADESMETLGSIVANPELKDHKALLLEAYRVWLGFMKRPAE